MRHLRQRFVMFLRKNEGPRPRKANATTRYQETVDLNELEIETHIACASAIYYEYGVEERSRVFSCLQHEIM